MFPNIGFSSSSARLRGLTSPLPSYQTPFAQHTFRCPKSDRKILNADSKSSCRIWGGQGWGPMPNEWGLRDGMGRGGALPMRVRCAPPLRVVNFNIALISRQNIFVILRPITRVGFDVPANRIQFPVIADDAVVIIPLPDTSFV